MTEKEAIIKLCPKCKIEKPLSEFHKRRGGKAGTYCKDCQSVYRKTWAKNNLTTERQRRYNRKSIYGLSYEEQDALPTECEICGSVENLSIDHDHETGLVRGVLCLTHNFGLSYFHDNVEELEKAIEYLSNHYIRRDKGG